jgi:hypothetical protein
MNIVDHRFPTRTEARVRYSDNSFTVLKDGAFVCCAVTGDPIPLSHLRYWSVRLQEPYKSAAISVKRHLQLEGKAVPAFLAAETSATLSFEPLATTP